MKRKRYTRKFQRMAVELMKSSENVGSLAASCGNEGRFRRLRERAQLLCQNSPGEELSMPYGTL